MENRGVYVGVGVGVGGDGDRSARETFGSTSVRFRFVGDNGGVVWA